MLKFIRSSKINESQGEADEKFQNEDARPIHHSISCPTLPIPNVLIEKIIVPPSTELISDEYMHEDNKQGLVLIFHSDSDKEGASLLRQTFSEYKYNVNVYKMSTKDSVMNCLRKFAETDHTDKTCLIAIFLGNMYDEADYYILPDDNQISYGGYCEVVRNTISLKDIWTPFTSDKCPSLKYKPKIFVFQSYQKPKIPVSEDIYVCERRKRSTSESEYFEEPPKKAYDVPAEADLLIIHKPIIGSKNRNIFIEQLCRNLHVEGHRDDIIDVVTHTEHSYRRPLIISTLTRKFYIKCNERLGLRGYGHELHVAQDMIEARIQDLHNRIMAMQEEYIVGKPRKQKKRWTCW